MDILEKDYFGLQYTDHNNVSQWLDPTKPVKKQVKSKFLASDTKSLNVCSCFSRASLHISDASQILLLGTKLSQRGTHKVSKKHHKLYYTDN